MNKYLPMEGETKVKHCLRQLHRVLDQWCRWKSVDAKAVRLVLDSRARIDDHHSGQEHNDLKTISSETYLETRQLIQFDPSGGTSTPVSKDYAGADE